MGSSRRRVASLSVLLTTLTTSSPPPTTSWPSSTPHGAVIVNHLPQSTKKPPSNSRRTVPRLFWLRLMPLFTVIWQRSSASVDTQHSNDSFDDVPFGILDADAAAALEVAEGQVALFKQFDEGRVNFAGEGSDALIKFVKEEQLALVNEFSDKTAPKIFGGDLKQHNLLFAAKSAADFDTIMADYSTAAKEFKGKLLFVLVDCDVEDNKRVMEFFGITEENCPDMRVINMEKNMAKFAPEKSDLTADGVKAFVNGVLDGSIKRHLKSEEVPDNSGNAVKVIVGKNFNDLVLDPTKNVFVEFYAPWCGHCKSLAPIWEELGQKYKDHANIVIAMSDATANEFEDVEVQGFPTLKFFPAGGEMQDYNGGRTLEDFVKFLEPDAATEEAAEEAEEAAADAKDEL